MTARPRWQSEKEFIAELERAVDGLRTPAAAAPPELNLDEMLAPFRFLTAEELLVKMLEPGIRQSLVRIFR